MNYQLTQSQYAVQQYSTEIRNQDRESRINSLRDRQRQRNQQTQEAVTYDFRQFDNLIKQFQDITLADELRFELLKPAIHFTDDDDNSHYAIKKVVEADDVVYLLKETVYNENISLEYRSDTLLLLAQMMYSNYELCSELLKQGILQLLIDLVKISFYHGNLIFLSHSLLGLANSITHESKIRTIYIENQLDQLILQILQKYDDANIKKSVARIMNDWFRSKLESIDIDLFSQIMNYVLIIPSQDNSEYKENLIWFVYGFISQVLDQVKDMSDQFIQSLMSLPNLTSFLRQKLCDKEQLGIVAGIRTITKIFRKVTDQSVLYDIFYDDLRILFRNGQLYEVNLAKIEILKLMQVMHQHPKCSIFAQEFNSTQHYYFYNLKCQEFTLLGLEVCNIENFDPQQLSILLNLCKNILMTDMIDSTKLSAALTIIQKILDFDNSYYLKIQDCIIIIEKLQDNKNTQIMTSASNLIENYKMLFKQ
ncbi:unnamed protein product (macronuclear) [Paramecium tetraurelia]|uniref:Beta-catenin-like protein 1 N-terminal domain-containing protein n=1 Tax=Paramecium tetraurelia TaxID=5888 RepID=A0C575_PARTE|nr:uncharacterized protein GSPATT00006441001 [Paramecium tetraurelia]CAK65942.1 unnamed protein product [Paramecium tetraurelia]|eukprot:XP_001433339.1 hypothetical protein (macronuclear) [Paramecium tetraurelia strain d4-2]